MKCISKTVEEIVRDYLQEHKYDGLYCEGECACKLDDLMPCTFDDIEKCKAGYETQCDCDQGCDFHIGPK